MTAPLYDRVGIGYADYRRPDPRIKALVAAALGSARTVLNVGAGTGSYEPTNCWVVAVEPSAEMIRQRKPSLAAAVQASADKLPFVEGSFEAALAVLTIHHWPDWRKGVAEMLRVALDRIVILTWDPEHAGFWLVREYFPEILELDRLIFPSLAELESLLGPIAVRPVPIPAGCTDGFLGAYWRRPAMYLNADARRAISTFARVKSVGYGLERLRSDLADGSWSRCNEALSALSELDIGYRLVIASSAEG